MQNFFYTIIGRMCLNSWGSFIGTVIDPDPLNITSLCVFWKEMATCLLSPALTDLGWVAGGNLWRQHGCGAVQVGRTVVVCVPVSCLGYKICFPLWGLYQKKLLPDKHRVVWRRSATPHLLFLKKSRAIFKPGQDLETAPGCAMIAVPGVTNLFQAHTGGLVCSKITA